MFFFSLVSHNSSLLRDMTRRASSKMTELRFQGEQPEYAIDQTALGIKNALAQGRKEQPGPITEQLSKQKMKIDKDAVHIRGALNAQLLQRKYQRKLDKHHFPPHIVSTLLMSEWDREI